MVMVSGVHLIRIYVKLLEQRRLRYVMPPFLLVGACWTFGAMLLGIVLGKWFKYLDGAAVRAG